MKTRTIFSGLFIISILWQPIILGQDSVAVSNNDTTVGDNQYIVNKLREDLLKQNVRTKSLLTQSEKNFELASKIIDWSAMFFAMLVVFLGIAGWIGARRFKQIDQTSKEMVNLLEEMREELRRMENLRTENQQSMEEVKRGIEKDRKDVLELIYYMIRGDIAYEKGEIDKAIDAYSKIISINQNSPEANYMLGNCYSANGDNKNGIEYLTKATNLKSDYYEAYYNLGRVYRRKGDHELAIKNLEKSIEIKPNFVKAIENLGHTYSRMGDNNKALECYNRSIAFDPDHAVSYMSIAFLYHRQGEIEKAINYCKIAKEKIEKKIQQDKYRYWDIYHMGQIHLVLDEPEKAETFFRQATSMNSAKATLQVFLKSLETLKSSPTPPNSIDKFIKYFKSKLAE